MNRRNFITSTALALPSLAVFGAISTQSDNSVSEPLYHTKEWWKQYYRDNTLNETDPARFTKTCFVQIDFCNTNCQIDRMKPGVNFVTRYLYENIYTDMHETIIKLVKEEIHITS